jgi:hypothetical protein
VVEVDAEGEVERDVEWREWYGEGVEVQWPKVSLYLPFLLSNRCPTA